MSHEYNNNNNNNAIELMQASYKESSTQLVAKSLRMRQWIRLNQRETNGILSIFKLWLSCRHSSLVRLEMPCPMK